MDDPLTIHEEFSKRYIARARQIVNEGASISEKIILIGQLLTRNDIYYDAYGNAGAIWHVVQSWHGDIPELDKDIEQLEKEIGRKDLARNYLGYIDDKAEAIFQNIQFCDAKPDDESKVYAFIDPSSKGVDDTAIAIGYRSQGRVVVYGVTIAKHWGDCLPEIVRLVQNCRIVYYEDNGGRALGTFLREHGIRVQEKTTTANKIAKIYGLRGPVQQGRLCLHPETKRTDQAKILEWTETAEHDDLPDAIAMLYQTFF